MTVLVVRAFIRKDLEVSIDSNMYSNKDLDDAVRI